nr:MAG TPA: hypothetical protein [Caudoviricetes sp.]
MPLLPQPQATIQTKKKKQLPPNLQLPKKPILMWVKLQTLRAFKYHCLEQQNQKAQTS